MHTISHVAALCHYSSSLFGWSESAHGVPCARPRGDPDYWLEDVGDVASDGGALAFVEKYAYLWAITCACRSGFNSLTVLLIFGTFIPCHLYGNMAALP
jgi:hypothetical protein